MNVRAAFEPNAKATEAMEPGMRPFDDPTAFAQATAVFGAAPADDRPDAVLGKSATMRVRIVATVGIDDLGFAKWSAACAVNRRDGVDERQQLGDIFAESSMMGAGIPWSVVQASKVNRYAEK